MYSEWKEKFYVSEDSPSGLRWAVDVYSGRGSGVLNVAKDQVAGSITKGRWQVGKRATLVHKIIWYLANGDTPDGFEVDHEDGDSLNNRVSNLRLVTRKVNMRNRKKPLNNTSGVCGVSLRESRGNPFWVAQWMDLAGKNIGKWFSVSKYGDEAFDLACEARRNAIENLNSSGAGYTERHGKGI